MNSIKTFWSPELKKERALRKDEATKLAVWKEQYQVVQEETQVGKSCLCLVICYYFRTASYSFSGPIILMSLNQIQDLGCQEIQVTFS